ncbi:MAG TPA: POTRA domain-containing protein [Chitinophagaceae bacterium]|nr:POTRA domain-containing protein [Chitinophagaceae bacterium]
MTRLRLQISVLVFHLFCLNAMGQNMYNLFIKGVDKDSSFFVSNLAFPTSFNSRFECADFINKLPAYLQSKGYFTASLDSIQYDSTFAQIIIFLGESYRWVSLDTKKVDPALLEIAGWKEKAFNSKPVDFSQVQLIEKRMLDYLENNGHPFAKISLDSVHIVEDKVSALLQVNQGPPYKIDSIRVFGNAKISGNYLQRYLNIPNGTYYSKEKLANINKKLRDLPYIEQERPFDISMLPTGSVVNLYLKQKKSNQVYAIIGFQPNSDATSNKKLLITGEGNLNLKNALGAGETIGLNFQALQVQSQRLNILYQHPYILNSPFGIDFNFDMFRKDSSFLNVNLQLGAQYVLSSTQTGKIFIQRFQTIVNGADKNFVLQNYQLPDAADVSTVNAGIDYEFNNTNYKLNPKKGNNFTIITTIGTKKIKKNNDILTLKDPNNPSFDFGTLYDTVKLKTYQLRMLLTAEKYLPIGKQSTIKTAINGGFLQSGNIFRNELFQIGGYKLLRGFDEQSQYLSQYAIATVEYHYLIGLNSYFYALVDGGWGRNNSQNISANYSYFGTGLGLAFETKAGIFNLAWAVGKRNDTELNLRQSKIHFGFVNYF